MTNEEMERHAKRYLALREVLITPGLDEGFYHTPNPGTAEGIDEAVDRLINFINHKRLQP